MVGIRRRKSKVPEARRDDGNTLAVPWEVDAGTVEAHAVLVEIEGIGTTAGLSGEAMIAALATGRHRPSRTCGQLWREAMRSLCSG